MARRAIVVAVEGLGCNMLGAYGGSWVETPELNASSIRALTCDQFWLDSIRLPSLYRSLWFGWHAAEQPANVGQSLAERVSRSHLDSMLVTDQSELIHVAGAEDFQQIVKVAGIENDDDDQPQTAVGNLFETALGSWLACEESPALLWIHSRGWRGPWDAPYDWREELKGEDDPDPPQETEPPEIDLNDESDPDIVLGWAQAAAAQARVLDEAWGWLRSTINDDPNPSELLVVLVGLQGYPMGEHRTIGLHRDMLHAERVHCPLILWECSAELGRRSNELVQPADLRATLAEWLQLPVEQEVVRRCSQDLLKLQSQNRSHRWTNRNQFAFAQHKKMWMLRTPSWCGLQSGKSLADDQTYETGVELYVHPEDRWQRNDVARRAVEITNAITQLQSEVASWYTSKPENTTLPTIPTSLIESPP